MPLYDHLLASYKAAGVGASAPLLAGAVSRVAAMFCVAPFELLKTRLQV